MSGASELIEKKRKQHINKKAVYFEVEKLDS